MIKIKGVANRRSYHSVEETLNILQAYLQGHGATIYARIDQGPKQQRLDLSYRRCRSSYSATPK
jgi:hypothetical protein